MNYYPLPQEQKQQETYKQIIMSKILKKMAKSKYQKEWYEKNKKRLNL